MGTRNKRTILKQLMYSLLATPTDDPTVVYPVCAPAHCRHPTLHHDRPRAAHDPDRHLSLRVTTEVRHRYLPTAPLHAFRGQLYPVRQQRQQLRSLAFIYQPCYSMNTAHQLGCELRSIIVTLQVREPRSVTCWLD